MKKYLYILCLFTFMFLFIPKNVFAENKTYVVDMGNEKWSTDYYVLEALYSASYYEEYNSIDFINKDYLVGESILSRNGKSLIKVNRTYEDNSKAIYIKDDLVSESDNFTIDIPDNIRDYFKSSSYFNNTDWLSNYDKVEFKFSNIEDGLFILDLTQPIGYNIDASKILTAISVNDGYKIENTSNYYIKVGDINLIKYDLNTHTLSACEGIDSLYNMTFYITDDIRKDFGTDYLPEYNKVSIYFPEHYNYQFISGEESTFIKNNISSYTLRINADYSLFDSISISNLNLVKDIDYIISEGSTIITFTESGINKLNTLDIGNYLVDIKYINCNEVIGKLNIISNINLKEEEKEEENIINPDTGDNIYIWLIFGIISIIGIISIVILKIRTTSD